MACGLERGPHAVCMVCAVSSGQTWPREAKLAQWRGSQRQEGSEQGMARQGRLRGGREVGGLSFPCQSFHSPSLSDHVLLPKARCPGGSSQAR